MAERQPQNFDRLIGEMQGALSENQLRAHFTLYQGYVKKLNEIEAALPTADRTSGNYSYSAYSELRRREPVAYNGTFLHEMYFHNLGAAGQTPPEAFKKGVEQSFGSWDNWIADVKACIASAHGWTLVGWDYNTHCIRNNLVQSEHHVGLLVNMQVFLAIDHWEHAYMIDYGIKKPDYTAAMLKHINWSVVGERAKFSPLMMPMQTPQK
ncbi:MAG TPA: Fe-Mn family superoxide dismutase [Polyangia bacterium]|jgi:Fe-Mn family superoxide dismutase|nr:Fe-Mn family superoxide dismutase [Polyangia bacterium]